MDERMHPPPSAPPDEGLGRGAAAVPQARGERDLLRAAAERHVDRSRPVPPLSLEELKAHAKAILRGAGSEERYQDFVTVLASNEIWRSSLASVPYDRRLLLLPQCLRAPSCAAPIDELGLICQHCGSCPIHEFKTEAEGLGYAVMVAEGTSVVMALIRTGRIQGIVGVGCLSTLEKMFPYMEAGATPGLAIPLLRNGCKDTDVDGDWVREAVRTRSAEAVSKQLDLETVRKEVGSWFAPESVESLLGPERGETDRIARGWLCRGGRRWRPLLVACACESLEDQKRPASGVSHVAVAVECFHKASLVHDDIEDRHATRYEQKTLHEAYGIPIALNVGDLLMGEGYRLLAECDASLEARLEMLRVASEAHRTLCRGQGAELYWMHAPSPLSSKKVIDIFRQKSAPPFYVALRLGAIFAGAGEAVDEVLRPYSEALGVAYQIRDDLLDFTGDADLQELRPSLLLALGWERASGETRERLAAIWQRRLKGSALPPEVREVLCGLEAEAEARRMLLEYKEEAISSLSLLENGTLKGLLRRLVARIFGDLEAAAGDHGDSALPS